jgi:peptide chain release factor 3
MSTEIEREIARRRTFAIISHPDAGKTTLTEKLLLYGGAIQLAGAVKARKSDRGTVSDWLDIEKERGISVSTAVMSFEYRELALNLLDTPGHNDFSEDTYRTLTAVDSVLMVIDGSKGVESQTRKLLEVCRLKRTPVITFVNKVDLEAREPIDLIDELERELGMRAVPMTWPIGSGARLKGVFDLRDGTVISFRSGDRGRRTVSEPVGELDSAAARAAVPAEHHETLVQEVGLIRGVAPAFDPVEFSRGLQTPVFFGSALCDFGVQALLDTFCDLAPPPQPRETRERLVDPAEQPFSGFVFKIQANMDRRHRDRMAFIRVCSGVFRRGMRLRQVRTGKDLQVRNAMTFLARTRSLVEDAFPGDIIGIPNHGTIRIADTFTEGEPLRFTGIPSFAPELFRRARLRDPIKVKALQKGLAQVCEEGTAQLFRPLKGSDYLVGALGELQFQVIEARLSSEYNVDAAFEPVPRGACRWVEFDKPADRRAFERYHENDLFLDGQGRLCLITRGTFEIGYIATKNPDVRLLATVEN